jgi:hypothetical protein
MRGVIHAARGGDDDPPAVVLPPAVLARTLAALDATLAPIRADIARREQGEADAAEAAHVQREREQ